MGMRGEIAGAAGGRVVSVKDRDSMEIIARLSEAVANGHNGLTREQGAELGDALNDIALRLERAADALVQLMRLSKPEAPRKNIELTGREMEILSHLAEGQTNGEIAARCWISENTVKFHLKNVFRKLDIRDRGQAMMIAKGMRHTVDSSIKSNVSRA
jgi:DNA-binding NarL/FixJ family response regulator